MKTSTLKTFAAFAASLTLMGLTACKDLRVLDKNISQLGYIYNEVPLADGGPGTLVGGVPHKLQIISEAETCFPSQLNGASTNLYRSSDANVADIQTSWSASADVSAKLIDFMNSGHPMLSVGPEFSKIGKMSLKMRGVKIDYIDSIGLLNFYENGMTSTCKKFLENYGFVTQALKVSELEFTFYDKTGAEITLDADQLGKLVKLNVGATFKIERNVSLVIDAPRYMGYQLGKLQSSDHGVALYRATRVRRQDYDFQDTSLFGGGNNPNQ